MTVDSEPVAGGHGAEAVPPEAFRAVSSRAAVVPRLDM
jgi:hypothetical protein